MQRLWGYLYRYRYRYLRGILCLVITATLAMSIPLLLKRAVEGIEDGRPLAELLPYLIAIIGIALVQGVVRAFSRFLIFNAGRDIEYELRNDLFAHLQRLSPSYYQRQFTGDLMSRLVNDVTAVRMLLGLGILNLLNTPLYYVYAGTAMLAIDPGLTVAALAPYPVMLLVVKRMGRQLMEKTLNVQEGLAALSNRVQEGVSGMHVVRAYVREEWQTREFARLNEIFKAESLALARVRGLLQPLMKGVAGVGVLVVLWYGGAQVIAGRLSLGDLVAFIGYLHLLAWPTMALGWLISIFQRGRAALKRLEDIFHAEPEIVDGQGNGAGPAIVRGDIAFRHVDFAYRVQENGHQVLHDIDCVIPAGATVAIVGRTGAGKSTLVHLLPRLFDVSHGAVTIDGHDVRLFSLATLRSHIGFVPQDPFLFSAPIKENIAFALPAVDEERIRWAAKIVHLDEEIESFPRGYDTVIGERGLTLSGGQKQRLTLARALVTDPPILVLDDALSSVDTQTERAILQALRAATRGKTVIVISHRIAAVRDADLIFVLDEGRIVERGTHAALVARGGVYAELFQQQALEEELAEL
ncbi:MAG: ABC transporter ATP-binding protein/permease [Candidatus Binatia bacterium]|nr:ABC transporter ATP-binding protein/permease [Candidatus Binatia bacterium]